MIKDEKELGAMQKRVEQFHFWLLDFRRNARPDEFVALASCDHRVDDGGPGDGSDVFPV